MGTDIVRWYAIVDKFRRASAGILSEERAEQALRMLLGIEELDDIDRLMALLRTG